MSSPSEYAPPHTRNNGQTPAVTDEYIRKAVAYVTDSVATVRSDREWVDEACRTFSSEAEKQKIDPVVAGLLNHLPKAGMVWPATARKKWLQLLEGSFDLIFREADAEKPT